MLAEISKGTLISGNEISFWIRRLDFFRRGEKKEPGMGREEEKKEKAVPFLCFPLSPILWGLL